MTDTTDSATTYVGRVKWFNNKTGFGFITVMTEGEHYETDVFVHHSAIQVKTEQYKYLVQGEYVHFHLVHLEEGDHEYQASDVVGINGGMLMCETSNESRASRYEDEDDVEEGERAQRQASTRQSNSRGPRRGGDYDDRGSWRTDTQRYRVRGGGPRDQEEWTLVREVRHPQRSSGRAPPRRRPPQRANTATDDH